MAEDFPPNSCPDFTSFCRARRTSSPRYFADIIFSKLRGEGWDLYRVLLSRLAFYEDSTSLSSQTRPSLTLQKSERGSSRGTPQSKERISCVRSSFLTRSSMFFASWTFKTPVLGTKIRPQAWSFGVGPPRLKVDTDVIHVIKWTRPFHSIFAYCKWSKTKLTGRLGMKLDLLCKTI